MFNFIIGIIVGFFVATYGVTGAAQIADKAIDAVKQVQITTGK